jgi:ABC-2 type transport system ATP-binding protein
MSEIIARIENVSKRFIIHHDKSVKERFLNFRSGKRKPEEFWALRDIDVEIKTGTTIGLVGHNGSGKSTLLKIIGGIIEPTSGSVMRKGRIAPLLELGAGFHPDLTGRENVFLNAAILGLSRSETERYFDSIVDFSGIEDFIDTQVKFYSSGMYVRLAFAIAVHVDPDFLLVDEVLAVGDQPFQRKCMDKIAQFQRDGRTIALVSHSAPQIGDLCDSVVVLERGKMMHNGNTAEGLRILREGYARVQQENSALTSHDGKPAVVIGEVEVQCEPARKSDGAPNLLVSFPVTVNAPLPKWVLGLSIWSDREQLLMSVNTENLGIVLPDSPSQTVVKFALTDLPLAPGAYSVSYGVVLSDATVLDSRNPAAMFFLKGSLPSTGPLRAKTHVTVSKR